MVLILMKSVFWFSTLAITISWFVYPVILYLVSIFFSRKSKQKENELVEYPSVTVLVTVNNEEAVIRKKIENLLSLDYPRDRLDLLIVSDRSDDATEDIVREYENFGIRLFRPLESCGKTDAQNQAFRHAHGAIVVFTDAETMLAKNFLMEICKEFADPEVGCAGGRLHFIDFRKGVSTSQTIYWRYELWVRKSESALGNLTTAPGPCMAVRKELLRQMDASNAEDDIIPLDIICQGKTVIQSSKAFATDAMPYSVAGELNNRIRLTTLAWQAVMNRRELLNLLLFPGVALSLIHHRILRWMTPFFLLLIYLSSFILGLYGNIFYFIIFITQTIMYLLAIMGFLSELTIIRKSSFCRHMFAIVWANVGFFLGIIKALSGHKITRYKSIQ